MKLVLRPSAKINLTLRVGPRRADGFHDVRTLLQSVALCDRLTLTPRRGALVFTSRSPGVPTDRTNLVWRAAEVLWRALGRSGDPRGVHLTLEKAIPPAAGLGGGSADAAAALTGLNRIWEGGVPRRALMALAVELGSDVPFFLQGGTALAASRGDEVYPVDDIRPMGVVLIKPSFGVSTADAYRWLDEDRAQGVPAEGPRPRDLDVGWPSGPLTLVNDLQAPVCRRHPGVAEMIDAAVSAGALAAGMTGSGSAVFAVFSEASARRAARQLQRPDWWVCLTRTASRRETARRILL